MTVGARDGAGLGACAGVVVGSGDGDGAGFGASAAAPIVRDTMTYLFDPKKAMDALAPLEKQWGGTLAERNARRAAQFETISKANQAAASAASSQT